MVTVLRRNYPRKYHEQAIYYTDPETGGFCEANLYNSSAEGLYFETDSEVKPGHRIRIKIKNDMPDPYYFPEAFRIQVADVVWCRELEKTSRRCFGIGARLC